jgi:hypothetical protein
LNKELIEGMIRQFKTLQEILNLKQDALEEAIGDKDAKKFTKEISSIREQALLGKKV